MTSHAENRRTLQGVVTSNKMQKSVVITVESKVMHPVYKKYVKRRKKYMAHDETNQCAIGDTVEIIETRPLSRHKTWPVRRVVVKAA